ncbi:MAG: DUF1573 domain-containing protein [Pirellulaceae bacterium]
MRSVLPYLPTIFASLGVSAIFVYLFVPVHAPSFEDICHLNRTQIDFGSLSFYQVGEEKLRFENRSNQSVHFEVGVDCQCTRVVPDRGVIAAGQFAELTVNYTPKGTGTVKSANRETSSLIVSARGPSFVVEREVEIGAQVFRPILANDRHLNQKLTACTSQEFDIDLSLKTDVDSLTLVSKPSFLETAIIGEFNKTFQAVKIRCRSKAFDRPQMLKGELDLTVKVIKEDGVAISEDYSLPLRLFVSEPFDLSNQLVLMKKNDVKVVSVNAGEAIRTLRISSVDSDCDFVRANQVNERQIELSLHPSGPPDLQPETNSRLRLVIECVGEVSATFTKHLPILFEN